MGAKTCTLLTREEVILEANNNMVEQFHTCQWVQLDLGHCYHQHV
jgi:hypothetical protein